MNTKNPKDSHLDCEPVGDACHLLETNMNVDAELSDDNEAATAGVGDVSECAGSDGESSLVAVLRRDVELDLAADAVLESELAQLPKAVAATGCPGLRGFSAANDQASFFDTVPVTRVRRSVMSAAKKIPGVVFVASLRGEWSAQATVNGHTYEITGTFTQMSEAVKKWYRDGNVKRTTGKYWPDGIGVQPWLRFTCIKTVLTLARLADVEKYRSWKQRWLTKMLQFPLYGTANDVFKFLFSGYVVTPVVISHRRVVDDGLHFDSGVLETTATVVIRALHTRHVLWPSLIRVARRCFGPSDGQSGDGGQCEVIFKKGDVRITWRCVCDQWLHRGVAGPNMFGDLLWSLWEAYVTSLPDNLRGSPGVLNPPESGHMPVKTCSDKRVRVLSAYEVKVRGVLKQEVTLVEPQMSEVVSQAIWLIKKGEMLTVPSCDRIRSDTLYAGDKSKVACLTCTAEDRERCNPSPGNTPADFDPNVRMCLKNLERYDRGPKLAARWSIAAVIAARVNPGLYSKSVPVASVRSFFHAFPTYNGASKKRRGSTENSVKL
jgi:hypothetical protein